MNSNAYVQILSDFLGFSGDDKYEMEVAERIVFQFILEKTKPKLSLEIGSRAGGSLTVISKNSTFVDCVDIDETIPQRLSGLRNVDFHIGDSRLVLPGLIAKYNSTKIFPDFVHIDGDHTYDGALNDIQEVLKMSPDKPVLILIHDSFNQEVRRAIKSIDLKEYPQVKVFDVDFMTGIYHTKKNVCNELWGGFALIYLDANIRGDQHYNNNMQSQFEVIAKFADDRKRAC